MNGSQRLAVLFALGLFVVSLAPSLAEAQGDDEAHALFDAGQHAYSDGRFEQALEYFQRAYDISHRALLLYNIGSAAEHLRHDADAIAALEQYLAEVPDADNRPAVEARLAILRASLAEQTTQVADQAPPPAETPPPPPSAHDVDPVPFVVIGIGAAAAITGAVLVGVGYSDASSVSGAADGATWPSLSGAYDRAPLLEGVGFGLIGVGVAAAVLGAVLAVTASSDAPVVTAFVDPHTVGLAVSGSF